MKFHTLNHLIDVRRVLALAVCAGLVFPFTWAFADSRKVLNAASLSAAIKSRGPEAVLTDLYQDDRWNELIKHVETGQAQWLQIAVQLRPAADQAAAALLTVAAGIALVKDPAQVLSVVLPTLQVEEVCGLPDVSDLRFATKSKATHYVDSRIAAVARLNQSAIADFKTTCLKSLQEAKQLINGPNGPFS